MILPWIERVWGEDATYRRMRNPSWVNCLRTYFSCAFDLSNWGCRLTNHGLIMSSKGIKRNRILYMIILIIKEISGCQKIIDLSTRWAINHPGNQDETHYVTWFERPGFEYNLHDSAVSYPTRLQSGHDETTHIKTNPNLESKLPFQPNMHYSQCPWQDPKVYSWLSVSHLARPAAFGDLDFACTFRNA